MNIVIVCDKSDKKLGDFFNLCKDYAIDLSNQAIDLPNIREVYDIDSDSMCTHTSDVNLSNFIFFGFVHGSQECMYINGNTAFINTTINHYLLSNAFIYTFSCHNGNLLADTLINNNAHTFWGYKDEAWVCLDYIEDFKKCALSGYFHFLKGKNIAESEEAMRNDTNEIIDELYLKNMLAASYLLDNRNAMVVKGKKDLTIKDFISPIL